MKHIRFYLGQQRNSRVKDADLTKVRVAGVGNYTEEVLVDLKRMFDNGEIDSYPIIKGGSAIWSNSSNREHRPGSLPAIEDFGGRKSYYINGVQTRPDGPAMIYDKTSRYIPEIAWYKDGLELARMDYRNIDMGTIAYHDIVTKNFPEAGKKIWIWDWTNSDETAEGIRLKKIIMESHPQYFKD